jgi:hypothetical protein
MAAASEYTEFYVTIPSTSSPAFYKNSTGSFRVHLPAPIELYGEWTVGLSQIAYSQSWYNVNETQNFVYVSTQDISQTITIPAGYYQRESDLISEINKAIELSVPAPIPKIKIGRYNNIATAIIPKNIEIVFCKEIAALLGFTTDALKVTSQAMRPIDLLFHTQVLYVFCDIIEPQLVETQSWKVLKFLAAENKPFGQIVDKTFTNTQYFPLGTKKFQTIHIQICNQEKEIVQFHKGCCLIQLHFKLSRIPIFY